MALVTIRFGSAVDIFQYDDGSYDSAIETTAPIKAGAPVDPNDVIILGSGGAGSVTPVSVTNIDDPSTELNALAGSLGSMLLAFEVEATSNQFTLYAFDASDTGGEDVPFTVDASGSGLWIAIGGKYSANLNLRAGEAGVGKSPLKFTAGTLLTTPEEGALEFAGNKLYITNVAHQRAIDRTSDVAVATVTVENTIVETTVWTATMDANSLVAGNVFKFQASGVIQNGGPTAADRITFRIKVGGNTIVTVNPIAGAIAVGSHWHIKANATQRTIGVAGSRAVHVDTDVAGTISELIAVAAINTTLNMDVTLTVQWASADANNIFSLYQAFMEYKN